MKIHATVVYALVMFCVLSLSAQDIPELTILPEDKKIMDPFEAHSLTKADQTFEKKQYAAAAADYEAFILEFQNSRVLPYVIFRKARSIHLDNKMFNAIKAYNEVLDYYPNALHYAAAALFFIGKCYSEINESEKALKAWKQMAEDKDYRHHYLAAEALNMLALNYMKQNETDKAISCYEQVTGDFRVKNPNAAWNAMWQVIPYYMKIKLSEPKLREFYIKAQGFDRNPKKIEGDINLDKTYWDFVRRYAREYGEQYKPEENDQKIKFYRYWVGVMDNKFPEWDDFQADIIDFQFGYENDDKKRSQRLDAQFVKYNKPDDYLRIVKWIGLYAGRKAKMDEYYAKLDLAKINNAALEQLMFIFVSQKEYDLARNIFEKIKLGDMNDQSKQNLARRLWEPVRAGFYIQVLKKITESFSDLDYGRMELFRYYYWTRDLNEGIPLAEKLASSLNYASESAMMLGDMLVWKKQYDQAIMRFQQANNPPESVFRVADCYVKIGKLDSAMASLTEIENFFPAQAPRAALIKANLYRDAGQADKRIAALRAIMKKYPKSGESSVAHQELEQLGVKIGGGQDAD